MENLTLSTERLQLRTLTKDDLEHFRDLETDEKVMRYLGGITRDPDDTAAYLEKQLNSYADEGIGLFAVFLASSSNFIGRAGIQPWTIDDKKPWEIGYTLKPEYWGSGYATELASFFRDWALQKNPGIALVSIIHPENHGSISVASKIGMRFNRYIDFKGRKLSVYRLNDRFR